jgi:menaquinone-dependent protoporphyrinogen IX oxidase
MPNALVLYFTKYGSTKKYAEWIAEELKGDIFDIKDARPNQLHEYDVILLGSALYAGSIK